MVIKELIDTYALESKQIFQEALNKLTLEEIINEFHNSREKWPFFNGYFDELINKAKHYVSETEINKVQKIIDAEFEKNQTNILHNHLVVAFCQKLDITLKLLLEYRKILRKYYLCGVNFNIEAHISILLFKEKSPIPSEDATLEYKKYFPKENKKKKENIDWWLVNTLLKKMAIQKTEVKKIYYENKKIGNSFGMKRAILSLK